MAVSLGRPSKDFKFSGTTFKETWTVRESRVKKTCPRICWSQLFQSFLSFLIEFLGNNTKHKVELGHILSSVHFESLERVWTWESARLLGLFALKSVIIVPKKAFVWILLDKSYFFLFLKTHVDGLQRREGLFQSSVDTDTVPKARNKKFPVGGRT